MTSTPETFDRDYLFSQFFKLKSYWLADNISRYQGDATELAGLIAEKIPKQDSPAQRTFVAAVAMWLGRAEGSDFVLASLAAEDEGARLVALDTLINRPGLRFDNDGRLIGTGLNVSQIVEAMRGLLQKPEVSGSEWARAFCIKHGFALARPHLQALRRHSDWAVAAPVWRAYVEHDLDEGCLDLMQTWLLEPAIRQQQQQRKRCHELCALIGQWAERTRHAFRAKQLGTLASKILTQALDAADRQQRLLPHAEGWLAVEPLLRAVGVGRPDGVAWLLQRLSGVESLEPTLRAWALVAHGRVSDKLCLTQPAVLTALWQSNYESPPYKLIEQLFRGRQIGWQDMDAALRSRGWRMSVLHAIELWPDVSAPVLTELMIQCLQEAATERPLASGFLRCLIEHLLPRAEGERKLRLQAVVQQLLHATAEPHSAIDLGRSELSRWLVQLGAEQSVDLASLPPWEAMQLHWQRESLDLTEVAARMSALGMIDPIDPASLQTLQCDPEYQHPLLELLALGGRPVLQEHLVNDGFEHAHDQLLITLASMLKPGLEVEDVVQEGAMSFTELAADVGALAALPGSGFDPTLASVGNAQLVTTEGSELRLRFRFQGLQREIVLRPYHTWMDDDAVVSALNQLLSEIGHAERVYRLPHFASWGEQSMLFLCAPVSAINELAPQLRLPLLGEHRSRPPVSNTMIVMGNDGNKRRRLRHRIDWTLRFAFG